MSFDIVDAYENIKQQKIEIDEIFLRQEFMIEILNKEGIISEKDFQEWIKEKKKENKNGGK